MTDEAVAGELLNRADLATHVTHPFDPAMMLPAPGQGALALEGRADDRKVRTCLSAMHDETTAVAVGCERAILAALDAGCRAPVAILAAANGTVLHCDALVSDPTGRQCVRASADGSVREAPDLVARIVSDLRTKGADAIIDACRSSG